MTTTSGARTRTREPEKAAGVVTETTSEEKPKRTRTVAPPFDWSSVEVRDSDITPAVARRNPEDNPMYARVRDSWERREADAQGTVRGQSKEATVPTGQLVRFKGLLNTAARDLDVGVSTGETHHGDGTVTVVFCARPRRKKSEANSEVTDQ